MGTEVYEEGTDWRSGDSRRNVPRQIAMEHELEVISGKVASDHVHMFIGHNPSQDISKIVQWLKGTSFRVLLMEFAHLWKQFCGRNLWA